MFSQVMKAYDLLDSAYAGGDRIKDAIEAKGDFPVEVTKIEDEQGATDFIKVKFAGTGGKSQGGEAPTLGIVGRLGGLGARPERVGFVSDGDGALTAVSVAFKLADMVREGDQLKGDVVVTTHICPNAPTKPHDPVPFMSSPVDMATMNKYEVTEEMDAVLSIDATKGNRVITHRGFAISPTVKEGYILRVSEDLMDLMEITTGKLPQVFPITTQDITPYGNGLFHLNSILQPATATHAPVVGVATCAEIPVPGCGTGATHLVDIEPTARFCLEVAKHFGEEKCRFYDEEEFARIQKLYGEMTHLQTMGKV